MSIPPEPKGVVIVVRKPGKPTIPTPAEVDAALVAQEGESVPIYLPYGECLTGTMSMPRRLLFDGDRIVGVVVGLDRAAQPDEGVRGE